MTKLFNQYRGALRPAFWFGRMEIGGVLMAKGKPKQWGRIPPLVRIKPAPDPNLDRSEWEDRVHVSQLSPFYRMDPDMRRMARLAETSPWTAAAKKAEERERRTRRVNK